MPSLIQTGEFTVLGYPLVQGGSEIVALGNASGGGPTNALLQEDGSFILAENGDYLVQE